MPTKVLRDPHLVAFGLIAFLASCTGGDAPKRAIVILFDLSGSTSSEEVRDRYREFAASIDSTLDAGDWIYGDVITSHSLADANLKVLASVPRFNPAVDNVLMFRKDLKRARVDFSVAVDKLIGDSAEPCTDLLNAFSLAAKHFSGRRLQKVEDKRLIIVSDMVQTCGNLNFTREHLTTNRGEAIIADEENAGRIPNLSGVQVWVAGAGIIHSLPSQQIQDIERFWTQYLKATGADFEPERYGPVLLDWP